MKSLALAVLVLASLLCAPPAARAQTLGAGDRGIYQTRLSNGLQVIAVEDRTAPVVHTQMFYRFGSLYETPGKTGLAHALEHMMFRGTPALSAGGLDDVMARLGGQMNGQTQYDYTSYQFDLPSDRLDVALQIEADRMVHLALRPQDWRIEQGAVLSEIDGDESSPFFNLLARVRAAAYPGLPAGRTPTGVRSDVADATVADLRRYYSEWYAPNNAALVVAGDVRHQTVFALAKRYFGAIPARALPPHTDRHPVAATGKTVNAEFPFPFEVLDLAYAVPGDKEAGEPAISTLANLISNERGPFYQALVETNVALEIDANADTQLRGGLMHVFIVLNPGHHGAEAQQLFQDTMNTALHEGFDPDLVKAAKLQALAERAFSADSIAGYGDLAGYTYGIVKERDSDEDARLAALTPADLLAAARTYLAAPNVVGHLTPNSGSDGHSSKSSAGASDNFSGRAPNGPIVEPPAIAAEIRKPETVRSKLAPAEFTLANGLRVIVQRKTDRNTVYIGGSIATSPAFTPPGKEGIARLADAMADFGSEHYDFTQLRKATDDIGASVTLGQRFGAHGFAKDLDTLLNVLADSEEHPTFPDRWLALEQSQLANSIDSENSISGVMIDRAYLQRLLPHGDPALRFPTPESVQGITRDDLLAYTQKYWRPDLTTIAIVGDVTLAQAKTAVQAAFGSWTNDGPAPPVMQPALPPAHVAHAYIGTAANQVFIQLGQPAIPRTSKDYDAFQLLAQIIGGPGYFESRLWQELRQKRGLVYSVSSAVKADRSRGDLEIELSAAPANVSAAIGIIRSQLQLLRTRPVSRTELQEAKTRLVASALLEESSADGQLGEIGTIARDRLPLDYYATLQQRYAAITPADLQRVAKTYLRPDKLIEIFSGPQGPWTEHAL